MTKIERQCELRRLNQKRYREYDNKPARKFSKACDSAKRKIAAMKMVCPTSPFKCRICGNSNLLHLTIDHADESGSQRNLYYKIIAGLEPVDHKAILCFNCNAGLRVLGHAITRPENGRYKAGSLAKKNCQK
jgi:hypothetical protein